jgi:Nif-specific regulatory protein
MPKLIVQNGINAGTIVELAQGPMVIGREHPCDIHLPDEKVSRRHARLACEEGRWTVSDLGSRNGTLVNGQRVEQRELASRDEITFGDIRVLFVAEDETPETLPPDDATWLQPTIAETVVGDRIELLSRGRVTHDREQLEHTHEALITLFRYSGAAAAAKSLGLLLDEMTRVAQEILQPDRLVPILVDPETGERKPWFRKASALDRRLAELPVSRSIIDFAFHERISVLSHAPAEDERFRNAPSIQLNRIATAMCVPLRSGDQVLGAVYADRLGDAQPFSRTDLELLTALALPTTAAIQNIRSGEALQRERQWLEREVRGQYAIIGRSPKITALFDFIERAAPLDTGVLLIGESGTGKELVARAIHYSGPRGKGPFEAVNCAALTESLLESELFGHVKGAFTGAHEDRAGRFELAHRGTLFLDEIAEMPPSSQAKLLRVLETGEYRRIGDVRDRLSSARVLAATNQDIERLVREGRFRQDLFYRLNILTCHLPPLREHVEDLELLCEHFLDLLCRKCGKLRSTLSEAALARLRQHPWPGNVRELRNLLERIVVLSSKGSIELEDLQLSLQPAATVAADASPTASLEEVERAHIQRVLQHTEGNKKEAARLLGIDRSTLYAKIKAYQLWSGAPEEP